jgi:hypothetical protein
MHDENDFAQPGLLFSPQSFQAMQEIVAMIRGGVFICWPSKKVTDNGIISICKNSAALECNREQILGPESPIFYGRSCCFSIFFAFQSTEDLASNGSLRWW